MKIIKIVQALNYFENFYIFISAVSSCVSIFAFASLVGVPVGTASSVVGIEGCSITTGINNCKSFIEKDRKKDDKVVP